MIDSVLKWAATATLIVGTAVNSLKIYPLGPIILIAGGLMWLVLSVRWREPALIVTNLLMTATGIVGLVYAYYH